MICVTLGGFDENLNSARKSIDIETKLYMVIVNRYIKVVVRRIFSISLSVAGWEVNISAFLILHNKLAITFDHG